MVDQREAHEAFMRATGFGNAAPVKMMAPESNHAKEKAQRFTDQFRRSDPKETHPVPGQVGSMPRDNRTLTPDNGLIPGHMPLSAQPPSVRNTGENPYQNNNLVAATRPFQNVRNPVRRDWRAVGVGKETDRRSDGQVAASPSNQGKLPPPYEGPYEREKKSTGMRLSSVVRNAKEKAEGVIGDNYKRVFYVAGAGAAFAGVMYVRSSSHGGGLWAVAGIFLLIVAVFTAVMDRNGRLESQHGKLLGNRKADTESDVYQTAAPSQGPEDTSRQQMFAPRPASAPDFSPYPKLQDKQLTLKQQEQMLKGGSQVQEEGPRAGFRYQRGPTPGNQKRLENKDLMRSARQHNFNEYEFNEYMARLDGEAPDQAVQRHPYMPLAAQWDTRQESNDMEKRHGVPSEPSAFNRKWSYRRPKGEQGGAKTMHTKSPPPGSPAVVSRMHPLLEESLDQNRMNSEFSERFSVETGSDRPVTLPSNSDTKLSEGDIADLTTMRLRENQELGINPNEVAKENAVISDWLKPQATTREGMAQEQEERQRKMQEAKHQGAAIAKRPPPHPAAPAPAQVKNYAAQPSPSSGIDYDAPASDPSPQMSAPLDAEFTGGLSGTSKEKSEASFLSAFVDTNSADISAINEVTGGAH